MSTFTASMIAINTIAIPLHISNIKDATMVGDSTAWMYAFLAVNCAALGTLVFNLFN
jgi:hypothetical protein